MDPAIEAIIMETKMYRRDLDLVLRRIKSNLSTEVDPVKGGREIALAITKVQEAIMWCGMRLKALNNGQTCYPKSYDPSSAEVESPVDDVKL